MSSVEFEFIDVDKIFVKDLTFTIPITEIAEGVRKDNENNLKVSKSFDGSGLAPIKAGSYKKLKQKTGHTKIFDGLRSGSKKLMNSIKKRRIDANEYEIYVGNGNNDIMFYLQQGSRPLAGMRRGFGVTTEFLINLGKNYLDRIELK